MTENSQKTDQNFISLSDASSQTGYHQDYLGYLCRIGKLKGFKIERNWVTTKENLNEFLNGSSIHQPVNEAIRQTKVFVNVKQDNNSVENKTENNYARKQDLRNSVQTEMLSALKTEVIGGFHKKVNLIEKEVEEISKHIKDQDKELADISKKDSAVFVPATNLAQAGRSNLNEKFVSNFSLPVTLGNYNEVRADNLDKSSQINLFKLFKSFSAQKNKYSEIFQVGLLSAGLIVAALVASQFFGFTGNINTEIHYKGNNNQPGVVTEIINNNTTTSETIVIRNVSSPSDI